MSQSFSTDSYCHSILQICFFHNSLWNGRRESEKNLKNSLEPQKSILKSNITFLAILFPPNKTIYNFVHIYQKKLLSIPGSVWFLAPRSIPTTQTLFTRKMSINLLFTLLPIPFPILVIPTPFYEIVCHITFFLVIENSSDFRKTEISLRENSFAKFHRIPPIIHFTVLNSFFGGQNHYIKESSTFITIRPHNCFFH